jgi:hypothetical protein
LLERDSHPLEYATLPGRTERLRSLDFTAYNFS